MIRRLIIATATCAIAATTSSRLAGQGRTLPRTADGHPDLSGMYDIATITPLERPDVFAGRATVAVSEAQKYAAEFLDNADIDRRDGGAQADVGRAYNNFFLDR